MRIILLLILSAVCSFSQIMSGVLSAGGNAPGTASTPTFSPSTGSTIASGSAVTITPQSGCSAHTYWATHTPPTTGDTQAVSITTSGSGSVTYYAKTIGCSGFADSAVGTATYTLTATIQTSDNFTGTDATAINGRTLNNALGGTATTTWSVDAGTTPTIQSNQLVGASGATFRASVAGLSIGTDYTVSTTFVSGGASSFGLIGNRFATGSYDGYAVRLSNAGSGCVLLRYDAGSTTDLWGALRGTCGPGSTIALLVSGTGATVTVSVFETISGTTTQLGADYLDTSGSRKTTAGRPMLMGLLDTAQTVTFDDFKVQ